MAGPASPPTTHTGPPDIDLDSNEQEPLLPDSDEDHEAAVEGLLHKHEDRSGDTISKYAALVRIDLIGLSGIFKTH